MVQTSVTPITVYTFNGNDSAEKQDFLAREEPLEIRIEYGPVTQRIRKNLSVTMRTPGADEDLVRGFLFTEGIIGGSADLQQVQALDENIQLAKLDPDAAFDLQRLERHFYTSSSCGVCGKTSIDAVKTNSACPAPNTKTLIIDPQVIYTLPETLRHAQGTFTLTGGLHAAALFDLAGCLIAVQEDVGRHNALDKLIGHFLQNQTVPLQESMLLLSGRASFELLQKAAMAGIRVVCAVGAPSSLAVATAQSFGIALIGFLRGERFNLYTKPDFLSFKH